MENGIVKRVLPWILAIVAVIGAILVAIWLFRTVRGLVRGEPVEEAVVITQPETDIEIADILADPQIYNGFTVAVEGRLTDWVTRRAFVLSGTGRAIFAVAPTVGVLVIRREPFALPRDTPEPELALSENPALWVRGELRRLDRPGLENEWGVDLDDEYLENWDEEVVMVVEEIRKL